MSLLGASFGETAIWLVPLTVVVVVLVGMAVVSVILVRLVRSITLSLQELQEVRGVLEERATPPNSAQSDDSSVTPVVATEGEPAFGGGEGSDNQRGGARDD